MQTLVDEIERYNAQNRQRFEENAYEHFLYRIKAENSMKEKCARMGLPLSPKSALYEIHDAIGLRIVCNFIDDIYDIVQYLRTLPDVEIVQEKDYIKNVKPNGYRSYHLILNVACPFEDVFGQTPGHYFAEVQLRTIAMDSWAALEHQVTYKKNLDFYTFQKNSEYLWISSHLNGN